MTLATLSTPRSDPNNAVLPTALSQLRVHMVGIGGAGMSGLAALLLRRGAQVSGSDMRPSDDLARLADRGARIVPHQEGWAIPPDVTLVVASAAVPPDHAELIEARRRGLRVMKYAELLGAVMARCDGIAISGTHGKSTTTAWLTFALRAAGMDPSFVVGATVPQLAGGSGDGAGPHFVVEACEYDRSFLNLAPRRAAILNIEEDHLDCYGDIRAIEAAFAAFAARVPADGLLLVNADDPRASAVGGGDTSRVASFGLSADADWRADDLQLRAGRHAFSVCREGCRLGNVHLGLPGRHNVMNALAVAALATDCGAPWPAIREALETFRGANRRLELRGETAGVRVLDDYAHHPTEIRATLRAARERYEPRRLWCVFQPHQHSRTRFLMADFARSFSAADHVVVPDIYFVRDTQRDRELVCAQDLVHEIRTQGGDAAYIASFTHIAEHIAREARAGDLVVTMGAGDIWKVADELVQRLRDHLPA